MISVCLIYSDDRRSQASQVVEYLTSLPYSKTYDLIQVCDGQPKHIFNKFRPAVVTRTNRDYFCRADLWRAAATVAKKRVMVILDCDRIVHEDFFGKAATIEDSSILYCPRLYQLQKDESLKTILSYFNKPITPDFAKPDFRVEFDNGSIRPAKNPMSGCVAFLRNEYLAGPGLANSFIGWGFNDTDYYANAYFSGKTFQTLDYPEFHIFHEYEVSRRRLLAMNAWNSVRFYDKWRLPISDDLYSLYKFLGVTPDFIRQTTLDMFLEETRGPA